jgi:hypothetical protein
MLSLSDEVAVDVQSPDSPEPVVFDSAAAAFEWFDSQRLNLVVNARAALDGGLPWRAWELAMVLSPIQANWLAASLERQIDHHSREAIALDLVGEVLLATGDAEDAAVFHQRAARMIQQLGDRWQQALATLHLADSEQALGLPDTPREHLTAALALLRQFPDNRAARLRADIEGRLA